MSTGRDHFVAFIGSHGKWFFAEYMFSGPCGANGPEAVQVVGESDVDSIDVWIIEE